MDEHADGKAALYAKLARVMGEIGELEKKGRNQSFNYDFIRDVDVNNALRPLLAEQGVAVLVGMEDVQQETITSGSGNAGYHTLARMSVTFADGETGATVTVPWYAEANDYQDKGVNKCATAGLKYALLKTFLIGSDEDPDASSPSRAPSGGGVRAARGGNSGGVEPDLETTVNFGKHEGETLGEIMASDPGYIEWLAGNWKWDKGRAMAQALLERMNGQPGGGNGSGGNGGGGRNPAGSRNATDFWRLAKQMIKSRSGFDSDIANAIKDAHQNGDGVDWDAAYADLESWTPQDTGDYEPPF